MSCITEILKQRDENGIIRVKLSKSHDDDLIIEGGGTYKDFEYLITFVDLGHRCGYVAVPPEHAYNEKNFDIDCHGGVTFEKRKSFIKDALLSTPCNDLWLGFDCGHSWDIPDEESLAKYYQHVPERINQRIRLHSLLGDTATAKDYNFVEQECHRIIDQLAQVT